MRDPDGTVELRADHVARQVGAGSPAARFLESDVARELSASGRLVPYAFHSSGELRSPRVPFVSHPHEWCDAQLRAAAVHTLAIACELLPHRYELKDASAWNVIFDGRRPLFCDHLSFVPIERREWWAFGQFVRHFVLPLAVSASSGVPACRAFQLHRDGLAPEMARAILGPRRFATRWWPLMLALHGGDASKQRVGPPHDVARFREHVYRYCELNLPKPPRRRSRWAGYSDDRPHYTARASSVKTATLARWLTALRPRTVIDLGANTGEFSRTAADCGSTLVIAIDSDHGAIQRLFEADDTPACVYPVLADLADLAGGRGWMGRELPGLAERLPQADVVMALAVVHHLAIAESIPLRAIADTLRSLTRSHAIVELIDAGDSRLREMALQRNRGAETFSVAHQRAALARAFETEDEVPIPDSQRTLVLLRRRTDAAGA